MIKKYLILLLLVFFGCSSQPNELARWLQPNGKVKVLSTIAMIDDVVVQIGGSHVDAIVLVKGELDPHSYQLVKGDDEKVAYADLIFYNGLGLEHGPSLREVLKENPKALGVGDWIQKRSPSLILSEKGTLDPHIWMDASLWAQIIDPIVEKLSQFDPGNAEEYKARGDFVYQKMMDAHVKFIHTMEAVPEEKRYLVTSHDAFNYFARAYLATKHEKKFGGWKKRFAAPEGLAPESQLSATDIRLILNHMKKYNIHAIFPESNVSRASIQKLLNAGNEEGMHLTIVPKTLYGDAMGGPGSSGDTYMKMLTHNVRIISKYLNQHSGEANES